MEYTKIGVVIRWWEALKNWEEVGARLRKASVDFADADKQLSVYGISIVEAKNIIDKIFPDVPE